MHNYALPMMTPALQVIFESANNASIPPIALCFAAVGTVSSAAFAWNAGKYAINSAIINNLNTEIARTEACKKMNEKDINNISKTMTGPSQLEAPVASQAASIDLDENRIQANEYQQTLDRCQEQKTDLEKSTPSFLSILLKAGFAVISYAGYTYFTK